MLMLRAAALSGYPELVTELGGDPEAFLHRFRIPMSTLSTPQGFVAYSAWMRVLEHTAKALACRDFGLQLSTRQDIGILGPLGVAVRNCESLGEAMQCASRYMFVHSPAISFSPEPMEGGRILFVFRLLLEGSAVQATELSIGVAARVVAVLAQKPQPFLGVQFNHARYSPMATYWGHFETPVSFGHDVSGLVLNERDLELPIHDASRQLRELAEDYLELHHADPHTPFSARVRNVIQRSLGTGASSCVDVSSAFALHTRTLQRQLRQEGTTFERLKDDARSELARGYIANHALPMAQVAALLDYSEQSALTRSCKRWFGQTPRALRAEMPDA